MAATDLSQQLTERQARPHQSGVSIGERRGRRTGIIPLKSKITQGQECPPLPCGIGRLAGVGHRIDEHCLAIAVPAFHQSSPEFSERTSKRLPIPLR